MPADFQAFSLLGCFGGNFEDTGLSGSVGQGGRNVPADVVRVQRLLNGVPASQGGPQPLVEFKQCGIEINVLRAFVLNPCQQDQRGEVFC